MCKAGYYLVAHPVMGAESCQLCSKTWFQGFEGTECTEPGTTLATLPVKRGFYRQSTTAQVVRKCLNIDANAACMGSGNATFMEAVQQQVILNATLGDFDSVTIDDLRNKLAQVYGLPAALIKIDVTPTISAASGRRLAVSAVQLTVTIGASPSTSVNATAVVANVSTVTSDMIEGTIEAALDTGLSINLKSAKVANLQVPNVAACAEGYGTSPSH